MNNANAQTALDDCDTELVEIDTLIKKRGTMTKESMYLTKYATMKTCGTIEHCVKTIIADYNTPAGIPAQLSHYVNKSVRDSSKNPSLRNIKNTLLQFSNKWGKVFEDKIKSHPYVNRIKSSMESLNDNRNAFAHGNPCTASFVNIKAYFQDAKIVIEILDDVVYTVV